MFENFQGNVEKEYKKRFEKLEDCSGKRVLEFFQSYCGQIRFFSSFLQGLDKEKLGFSEFSCVFSLFSWLFLAENEEVSKENVLWVLNNYLEKYENVQCNCVASAVFLDLLRKIKKKCGIKKNVSFFDKIIAFSERLKEPTNFVQFLVLFDDYVNNFSRKIAKNKEKMQKIDKIFEIFQLVFLELALKNPNFSVFSMETTNFNVILSILKNILYNFRIIHENTQAQPINMILMKYLNLLDDLLKNTNENSKNNQQKEQFLIFFMGLLITSQKIEIESVKFIIDNFFFTTKIFDFLTNGYLKNTNKNELITNKFYLNLIKTFADALGNGFNLNYFEEIFCILDEYVLHLIEPSFSKLFSIISNKNTKIHSLEKHCISLLIKKALTHKYDINFFEKNLKMNKK